MCCYTISQIAEKCDYNQLCLKDKSFEPCKILDCVGERVFFVDPQNETCSYQLNYGYRTVCLCPIRKELYIQYKQ